MAGIEVAGLVLGAFPILVKCLEEYRRGFEPLEEWWDFRNRFIAFVDTIHRQRMLFHENMTKLLDPIITNNDDLRQLVANVADPRWNDGSLSSALQTRLASELGRLMRIINRMHEIIEKLMALLQIKDGQVSWLGTCVEKPVWQWHLMRLRMAFNKNKDRKVRKLGEHNQELKEILGFSETMLDISSKRRTASDSAKRFDQVRQNALSLFNALCQTWSCTGCQEHQANLKLRYDAPVSELEMLLLVRSEAQRTSVSRSRPHRVLVKRTPGTDTTTITDIMSVPDASVFSEMQRVTEGQLAYKADRPSISQRLSSKLKGKGKMPASALRTTMGHSSTSSTSVSFSTSAPNMLFESLSIRGPRADTHVEPGIPSQDISLSRVPPPTAATCSIQSLCTFLTDSSSIRGTLSDEFNRLFELTKDADQRESNWALRLSLHEMLEGYHNEPPSIELPRRTRFEMAAHIASAILQANQSPWLLENWTRHSFYFLVDPVTRKVQSSHAFVSRSFPATPADTDAQMSEEMVNECLCGVGIMIMELVFGCSIERSTVFRSHCGDDAVNQQAYGIAAKQWQKRLESESGREVANAVFKCLYEGGFGLAPCLTNSDFRKEVYRHLVEPLVNYKENWVLEPEDEDSATAMR